MRKYQNKLLEYLFYLFVFLLPWQTVFLLREIFIGGEKWQYGTIGIYGIDFLMLLFLILSSVNYLRDLNFQFPISNFQSIFNVLISKFRNSDLTQNSKFKIKNYGLLIASGGLIILSFLSIVWSFDKLLAFYFSSKLFLAASLFWSVLRIKFDWKKLIFILILGASLQSILAIGQFLTQQDFANAILGTSHHEVFAGGTSVVENQSGRWLRAYGSFPHPNMLGGYLAIILLLGIFFWLKYTHENKTQFFLLITLSIIFSGLVLSFSRSAWLIFTIGLFFIFIFQKEKRKELWKIAIIFLLTLLIWTSAFSSLFFSRFSGEDRLEQKSISDRTEYVQQTKEIIKDNFWLGAGAGNYTKEVFQKNPQKSIWQIQPVHNVFLLIWSELGIIGLLIFIAIIIFTLFSLKNNPVLFLLLTSYFLLLFFDHWLWTTHFGILLFFLAMGMIIKEALNS
ncbi:MAG TPA: hypothetical protein DCS28_04110 [Candidatus Moranbacteria bacterium]|nr:hypothetical protein [Candidatus Moranbacteria bacterium]HAT75193.1 hypothetical protein [Candidatus Moranbacteria bacterium]